MGSSIETEVRMDELETVVCCPVCGGAEVSLEYLNLRDYLENVPGRWSFLRCINCKCIFLNPRPNIGAIGKAYRSYYTHGSARLAHDSDNGHSVLWSLVNGYLNARYGTHRLPSARVGSYLIPLLFPLKAQLDFFLRHLPPSPGHLLDVGCGNGLFLMRARDAGWSTLGLEPDPIAANVAREAGVAVVEGTLDEIETDLTFDVVSASHVIEHVHDPQQFLRRIYSILKPGGTLWVATPNIRSMGHAWYGSAWRGLEPPRHLVLFSKNSLRTLLTDSGYTNIKFRRRGRGARYILDASEKIAALQGGGKKLWLPVFLVDIFGTLINSAAEELIVTAERPR